MGAGFLRRVMYPELIQAVLLDDVESFNKRPIMIACWARGAARGFRCRRRVATLVACLAVSRPRRWRVAGDCPIGREQIRQLPLLEAIFGEEIRPLSAKSDAEGNNAY